jgi:hypothetical protein
MAGVIAHVNSGECTLAASTAKSLLQIKAATNQRVLVKALRILGKQAAGGTDAVVKVRITRNSASFGTFSSATPSKNDPSDSETIQTTAGSNATVEPTSPTDAGLWYEVQPQIGIIELFPPGMELKIPGGQSIQVECTSTGTPTLMVSATFEE